MKIILTILLAFSALNAGAEQIPVTYPGLQAILRANEGTGANTQWVLPTGPQPTPVYTGAWVTGRFGSGVSSFGAKAPRVLTSLTSGSFVFWYRSNAGVVERNSFPLYSFNESSTGSTQQFGVNATPASGRLEYMLGKYGVLTQYAYINNFYSKYLIDRKWHFIAVTWANSRAQPYIDGAITSDCISGTWPAGTTNGGYITGCVGAISAIPCGNASTYAILGTMDEIAFFSTTLSPAQIKELYQMGRYRNVGQNTGD